MIGAACRVQPDRRAAAFRAPGPIPLQRVVFGWLGGAAISTISGSQNQFDEPLPRTARHRGRSPRSPPPRRRRGSPDCAPRRRPPSAGDSCTWRSRTYRGGDPRQRVTAYKLGKPPRQRPLLLICEVAPQDVGDDKAKHPVAEEFKPLVTAPRCRAGRRAPRTPSSGRAPLVARRQRARMGQRLRWRVRAGRMSARSAEPDPRWPMPLSRYPRARCSAQPMPWNSRR